MKLGLKAPQARPSRRLASPTITISSRMPYLESYMKAVPTTAMWVYSFLQPARQLIVP